MGLRPQHRLARPGQHIRERHAAIDIALQHQRVDEEAHHALDLGALAVGHGRADADVALAREPVQQGLQARQQHREQRRASAHGRLAQAGQQRRRQREAVARGRQAPAFALRRTRPVGRQFEPGWASPSRCRHQASWRAPSPAASHSRCQLA